MPTPKPRTNTPGRKRRMLGWTFITLGVLFAGMWMASGWWRIDYFNPTLRVGISSGCMGFSTGPASRYEWLPGPVPGVYLNQVSSVWPPVVRFVWWLGFEYHGDDSSLMQVSYGVVHVGLQGGPTSRTTDVWILLWPLPLLLLAAGVPLLRLGNLARRRAMGDKCKACGYDLAGLPLNAKCPECAAERVAAAP